MKEGKMRKVKKTLEQQKICFLPFSKEIRVNYSCFMKWREMRQKEIYCCREECFPNIGEKGLRYFYLQRSFLLNIENSNQEIGLLEK